MNKKIFFWALYDFANSLISANLTLYLSQWVIVENNFEDIWYSSTLAIATILLIFTAPFLGIYSDKTQKKLFFIKPLTLLVVLITIILAMIGASSVAVLAKVIIVLALFTVAQYFYQLSLIFYDTLLPTLTTPKNYGKISGIGEGMGTLGFLVGLFFTYPFANGKITLFGTSGRIQTLIPSAVAFLLLALPMLISFKDKPTDFKGNFFANYRQTFRDLRDILKNRDIFLFLLAFHFISDAVLTIQTFSPVYFQEVLGVGDLVKIMGISLVLVFVVIGAVLFGRLSDKAGYKKTLMMACILLASSLSVIPLINKIDFMWFTLPFVGLFWGGFYAISRAYLTRLAPKENLGKFFSLFTIFRRFSSVIGPMVWGLSVLLFSSFGNLKYRFSIYPLVALMVVGILLLRKVAEVKKE